MTENRPAPTRFLETIAGKITLRSMLMAAIPVFIIGLITTGSLFWLANNAENQLQESQDTLAADTVGDSRESQARLLAQQMDAFIGERIEDTIDLARSQEVVTRATADYTEFFEENDLPAAIPTAELRDSRDGADLPNSISGLELDGSGNQFLLDQVESRKLDERQIYGEIFYTDQYGYNVSRSGQTSDFIQSDENWWIGGRDQSVFLSPIEFDQSAEAFSFEISVRIVDAQDSFAGVLKSVVDVSVIDTLANNVANQAEGINVRVQNSDGLVIADTDPTSPIDIVGSTPTFTGDDLAAVEASFASPTDAGSAILEESVVGFARTSNTRTIDRDTTFSIANEDWIAFVEQDQTQAFAAIQPLDDLGNQLFSTARLLIGFLIAFILVTIVVSYFLSRAIANRIAKPINDLRVEAKRVAEDELPELVKILRTPGGEGKIPEYEVIDVDADGEVGELTLAFNSVRDTAVEIAGGQVLARNKDVASLLLNLGRRNQQLIGRQLKFIDDLEQTESNPDTLKNLFQLDQMATRMRRNAESLLVLAGEDSRRRGTKPMPIKQVARAASGEVEDYARVEVSAMETVLLVPQVVSDVTHLMAELIENAASFSPPDSPVEILGAHTQNGSYTLSIIDHGVGMEADRLAQFNARLRGENVGEDAPSTFLGLYVVGRLAMRHGIYVRLVESATSGITAKLTLPPTALVSTDPSINQPPGSASLGAPAGAGGAEIAPPSPPSLLPPTSIEANQPKTPSYAGQVSAPTGSQVNPNAAAFARTTQDVGGNGSPQPVASQPVAEQTQQAWQRAEWDGSQEQEGSAEPQGSVYTNEFHLPNFQPRKPTGAAGVSEAAPIAEEAPISEVAGSDEIPIPPFRPRQPSASPADSQQDQPLVKAKADEVRDRLERFSDGVATAKAAASTEVEQDGDRQAEQVRNQLTSFAQGIEKARSESADKSTED